MYSALTVALTAINLQPYFLVKTSTVSLSAVITDSITLQFLYNDSRPYCDHGLYVL